MSDKRRFIQLAFALNRPPREKFPAALAYAEDAWDFLSEHGYGASETGTKPRETGRDHYTALTDAQRARFDRWWAVNDYKVGKQRAAMVWARIDPDDAATDWIVSSTRLENRRWKEDNPGHTRPYPELWLNERRWEDHPKPQPAGHGQPKPPVNRAAERQKLIQAQAYWAKMHKDHPSDPTIKQALDKANQDLSHFDAEAGR